MEQIAAYISLFGVVLIARPVSLFAFLSHTGEAIPPTGGASDVVVPVNATADAHHLAAEYDAVTPGQRASAVGVALLGVLGAAGAYTTIRWIGKRAHPLISVNYFATWCTIVSIVMMFALPGVGFLLPSSFRDWCYLIFLGICGFVMVSIISRSCMDSLLITKNSNFSLLQACNTRSRHERPIWYICKCSLHSVSTNSFGGQRQELCP
jgi:hypothetical protein